MSGLNSGGREEGRRSWITGGEGLSTVSIAAQADSPVAGHLTLASRNHMGGLCVEESASGRSRVDGSNRSGERGWEDPDQRTSNRVGGG